MTIVLPFTSATWESAVVPVRRVLERHGALALPTETYYGLAVSPTDEWALRRLQEIKGRPADKPILVLIGHQDQLASLVASVPPAAKLLMDRFWPGPLTIIFPAAPALSSLLTAGSGTIGVRLPPVAHLQALLREVGPLTGTSANRSAEPPLDRPEDVERLLGQDLDVILDGGRTPGGPASTLVDTCGPLRVLRPGVVDANRLRAALAEQGYILSP
ncbi:MAG: threonylcarbamoyl-AMP synthase [Nitrospiraceae bacterium]|nr:threonylcarbamoyl-AMP synthase [Nitrospiraceae bacterium]